MAYKKENKTDLTYLPPAAVNALARVMEKGGTKHGRDNYLTNPDVEDRELVAAAGRHWLKMLENPAAVDDGPGGTGELHAACVMANAAMLIQRLAKAPPIETKTGKWVPCLTVQDAPVGSTVRFRFKAVPGQTHEVIAHADGQYVVISEDLTPGGWYPDHFEVLR